MVDAPLKKFSLGLAVWQEYGYCYTLCTDKQAPLK